MTDPEKKTRPSWKLKPPHDVLTQGVVVSGFVKLPSAQALFLNFDWPENGSSGERVAGKGAWLQTLEEVATISDADGVDPRAAAIAFTWTGLQKLGLEPAALATFSAPFREGMYQEDRLRRLGDKFKDEWQGTVIQGGPRWGANTPVHRGAAATAGTEPRERKEREAPTPITVHALLLLYDQNEDAVRAWAEKVAKALGDHSVRVVHQLSLDLTFDKTDCAREHFGFADGVSQPIPYDEKSGVESEPDNLIFTDGQPVKRDRYHGIPLGEILFGHTNAHHEKAPGPVVLDDPKARQSGLKTDGAPEGFCNLGLDGSYMVVRELRQRVAAFWKSLESGAQRIRTEDPAATHVTADWLAERVIGRNIDGHMLCPTGLLSPDPFDKPMNDFGFREVDPNGTGCPVGSHVRRANPRDSLAKDLKAAQTLLDAANNHRILRRGRNYGTKLTNRHEDDGADRGLLFICLNTDIARQFEFVQQTWLLNKNFSTLFDETDPLVGPKGHFTIRDRPLRRRVEVETFVQMAGGEYFFLPSIPALKYLALL